MMKKYLTNVVFLGLLALCTGGVWAHSDEYLATAKAPHGGQLRTAGPYHLELVAKDGELRLYVTDHMDNEILTKHGSGKANVIDKDGNKVSVTLVPVFANFMKGTGEFTITPETVVSVFVVLEGAQTQAARFTPLQKASVKAKEEEHHHHGDAEQHEQQSADQGEHEHSHGDVEQEPTDQDDAAENEENEEHSH